MFEVLPEIYVPTFEMKVDDTTLKLDDAKKITQISVTEHIDPSNEFSFQFYDPDLKLVDPHKGVFKEGTKVEINIGYVSNTRKMITGKISSITAEFPASGPPLITVDGFDLLHSSTHGTHLRKYDGPTPDSGPKDSNTVSEIARKTGLSVSVDETPDRNLPRVQNHITDFAFLEHLAHLNGYFLWVENDTLHFKLERPPPSTVKLEWGKTLQSFHPRLSTVGQVTRVVVRYWDPGQKQSFAEVATSPPPENLAPTGEDEIKNGSGSPSELVIGNAPVSNASEAKILANSILTNLRQKIITGNGTSVGNPDIRVGSELEISGTKRFDAKYIVSKVTHTIGDGGYRSDFELNGKTALSGLQSSENESVSPRANYGVIVGIVIDNKDPQGQARVKVKFPASSDEEVGYWARISTPMAGAHRGLFFLPENNDEVLIAFEYGDMARPYIIGALWNGKDSPPEKNSDGKNNIRLIKSRSGHILSLDDTDGSEKIEIIDKSGDNSLTFDTSKNTITIKSAQDVSIEAPNGKIKLSAKNIEASSTSQTKIQSDGGLDIGSSSDTTIKGQMVNIN